MSFNPRPHNTEYLNKELTRLQALVQTLSGREFMRNQRASALHSIGNIDRELCFRKQTIMLGGH
jgi:hypothetical protein